MTITIKHNGIEVTDIVNGYLLSKLYIGYDSQQEVIELWNKEIGNRG